MIVVLSENVNQTIDFLNNCSRAELYYLSEVFEDISYNLKIKKFVETLYKLDSKYPELAMKLNIELADEYSK